ncbi:MAG: STAS domain-containing protein [Candidatus Viridilinea halotolerans]|uniref:STAS domain-containing protein n=1 Tax=Candidatus Viridilinea halotolerans TaxID=2491704 RepID=A0A426U4U7_9CHLR|nr:MAG: STAS domain-containing protein [Candidatus Viridilinea halotolerans]
MPITQRNVALLMLSVLTAGTLILALPTFDRPAFFALNMATTVVYCGLLFAYWRGWEPARYIAASLVVVLMLNVLVSDSAPINVGLISILTIVLALVMMSTLWAFFIAIVILFLLIYRSTAIAADLVLTDIGLFVIIAVGIFLIRLMAETARRQAEAQALHAEQARAQSETQALELSQRSEELRTQNEEQARLLALVATLETPAVQMADGVLLAPVVGQLDSRRASQLTSRLLREVSARRARLVIFDIAGVSMVDTGVAQAILHAVQAVRLLGCDVTITGISASVATTMTHLGINLSGVKTARTPQDALAEATKTAPAA